MIHLFASDMDGTLLDNTHQVNQATADAIKIWQAHGREFLISTGRDLKSARDLLANHQISCAMINLNGALIHDENDQVIGKNPLDPESQERVIAYLQTQPVIFTISTQKDYYMSDPQAYLKILNNILTDQGRDPLTQAQISSHAKDALDFNDFVKAADQEILKLMVISDNPDQLAICRKYLEAISSLDITSSGPGNLEITSISAQKGQALSTYLTYKGYTPDQVATIGDSLNDRSMLSQFPHSYAMENASDEVKALATHIAPSNGDNGVAKIMMQLLD